MPVTVFGSRVLAVPLPRSVAPGGTATWCSRISTIEAPFGASPVGVGDPSLVELGGGGEGEPGAWADGAQDDAAAREMLGEEGRGAEDEVDDDAAAPAPATTLALGVFWDCSKAQEEILSTVVRP